MKVLFTGDNGFIGRNLWEQFKKYKADFYGYDLTSGDDILDLQKLEYVFETEHFDTVLHLAALTGARRGELFPENYIRTNILGTFNLIEMSKKYGVKNFINFSSSSAINPQTLYGLTKRMAEHLVGRATEIPNRIIIRPFTVIGPNGRQDQVIYKWMNLIKQGKSPKVHGVATNRNFTYVGDVVKFVVKLLDNIPDGFKLYELCNPSCILLGNLMDIFDEYYKDVKWTITELDRYEKRQETGIWSADFAPTNAEKIIRKILKNG